MLIHWHLPPEAYKNLSVYLDRKADAIYSFTATYSSAGSEVSYKKVEVNSREAVKLSQLSHLSVYVLYPQSVGLLFFWLLIIKEISHIIKSVKGLQTFRSSNSNAFKNIGLGCLGIALLSAFKWTGVNGYSFFGLYFQISPLAFALGAFILAEIFKEGNKLYEAEQLTI